MRARPKDAGIAGVAALVITLSASTAAAGLIWLLTSDPASLFGVLATTDDAWDLVTGLLARLLAII